MSAINNNPYGAIQGLDGLPLDQGYIYIGAANQNPVSVPQSVYYDAAMTIPAVQPLRTVNGRVFNPAGAVTRLYVSANYSIQVLDKNQSQVFIDLNVSLPVDSPVPVNQGGTGATTAAGALANLGVIAALILQTYQYFTTGGISTAYTLTPSPALAASPEGTRYCVKFHTASGSNPTLSISGLGSKSMKQYDNTGAKVQAVVKLNQISDIVDDGTDYVVLDQLPSGGAVSSSGNVQVRNVAQYGAVGLDNAASFVTAGAALNYNILATAIPLGLTFGAGYPLGAQSDLPCVISANASNQGALGYNNTNYNFADYVNGSSVTWGSSKAPPQYESVYDVTRASLLQFGGAAGSTTFLDDLGNTWSANGGAKVQANQFRSGTGGLGGAGAANALNGTTDYISSPSFSVMPDDGWFIRGWFYITTLPANNTRAVLGGLVSSTTPNSAGMDIEIYNNAGTIRFAGNVGNGAYQNVAALVGSSLPAINTFYFVELTYDKLAGIYRLYVNGVQEAAAASALKVGAPATPTMFFGGAPNGGGFVSLTGYADKFEYGPYCDHPAGVAYAPPGVGVAPSISAAGYAQDWYDIAAGQMKRITAASGAAGTPPTFSAVNRIYHSEQDTNGTNVIATRVYAYNGRYDQIFPTTAVTINKNHNIGCVPRITQLIENGVSQYKALTLTRTGASWAGAVAQTRLIAQRGF